MKFPFSIKFYPSGFFSEVPAVGANIYYPRDGVGVEITERGDGYIYRTMRIFNDTENRSDVVYEPFVVDVKIPCEKSAVLYSMNGDDCSERAFFPSEREFSIGDGVRLEPCGGRSSSATAFPFFDIVIDGRAYLFAVGWTGQWQCIIERNADGVCVKIGLRYADFYIERRESFSLASVCVIEGDDVWENRRSFRRILREELSLMNEEPSLPFAIQPFDRYFYGKLPGWDSEEGQLKTLAAAQKCGEISALWLDAAWFREGFPRGVGNFSFADGFARGLKPVSDAVHAAGMRFVLWFEPERVYKNSEVYRKYPNFLLKAESATRLFDLGNEAAWEWILGTLSRLIEECGVDIYRQDFNIDPLPFWLENDAPCRRGITEIKYINGLYRLWDALREKFPRLVIDDCASGGRRVDLETMRRAVLLWRSDTACFPISNERPSDMWNQNQTLALARYLPYQCSAVWEPRANDFRSAMSAGIACAFDVLNENFDFETAKKLLFEARRLSEYWRGDFYPITEPTLDKTGFCAYQFAANDGGFAAIFRRELCDDDTFLLIMNAIDENASYAIRICDEKLNAVEYDVSGREIAKGINVKIPEKRSSATLEYKKLK